jgi:hypothetical protein
LASYLVCSTHFVGECFSGAQFPNFFIPAH